MGYKKLKFEDVNFRKSRLSYVGTYVATCTNTLPLPVYTGGGGADIYVYER
jgi:hypothetical protein